MEKTFSVKFNGSSWEVVGLDKLVAFEKHLDISDEDDFQSQCDNYLDHEWTYKFEVDGANRVWYDGSVHEASGEDGDFFEANAVLMAFDVL